MTKTLTKHLQAIKAEGKGLFIPYIMAGDHDKGLDGLFDTISFWKLKVYQPLKLAFHGRILWQMVLLLNWLANVVW